MNMRLLPIACLLALSSLALPACGECDETWTRNVDEALEGAQLDAARADGSDDEERCENACLGFDDLYGNGAVIACAATGADSSLPTWDAGQTSVQLVCTLEGLDDVACTQ